MCTLVKFSSFGTSIRHLVGGRGPDAVITELDKSYHNQWTVCQVGYTFSRLWEYGNNARALAQASWRGERVLQRRRLPMAHQAWGAFAYLVSRRGSARYFLTSIGRGVPTDHASENLSPGTRWNFRGARLIVSDSLLFSHLPRRTVFLSTRPLFFPMTLKSDIHKGHLYDQARSSWLLMNTFYGCHFSFARSKGGGVNHRSVVKHRGEVSLYFDADEAWLRFTTPQCAI